MVFLLLNEPMLSNKINAVNKVYGSGVPPSLCLLKPRKSWRGALIFTSGYASLIVVERSQKHQRVFCCLITVEVQISLFAFI